ncbi:zinc transport system ATP-binding protein [Sporomusaceae bacterium BoRhaA]|uniref:metal ABC transporter ATP-binding protein n=1 Tax=Pelorhabdus rhamnosifermentans TaxID=2772457 RepID=UPI001C062B6F|nr:ATP-binding cassette domain-containing protein [Pelorhabdus rhamnosifermentans]MBU2700308.1 zinc transport system ATP-binding protein [Pelorhabdus rhamnosifermentans]
MITIQNLWFSYTPNKPYFLKDLNLTIHQGDYISILGENGSGKSTLIKLLLKLLTPTKGKIVNDFTQAAYVPQRFENLNIQFPITVYEILDCYRKTLKIKEKDCIFKYLDLVKMSNFSKALIGTLSGGQCQKIFIARALLGNPDLLVLDEPSNGVDLKSQDEIYCLIKNINRTNQVTVISVEHNLKAAIDNSTLIYHLCQGSGHLCSPNEYINEYLAATTGGDRYASL